MHIEPGLGSRRLDEVKRADIKSFIAALRSDNISSARIKTIMGVLSGIFTSAIEDEILAANPCSRTGKYSGNGKGKEINPLTPAEVSTLLEKASQNLSDVLYTLFLLLARTGLRIGKALALEWSDIILKSEQLRLLRIGITSGVRSQFPRTTNHEKWI